MRIGPFLIALSGASWYRYVLSSGTEYSASETCDWRRFQKGDIAANLSGHSMVGSNCRLFWTFSYGLSYGSFWTFHGWIKLSIVLDILVWVELRVFLDIPWLDQTVNCSGHSRMG